MSLFPWSSCSGGHVWSEWEPTDWWEVKPFENKSEQVVYRKHERHCTRDGCGATEETDKSVGRVETDKTNATLNWVTRAHSPKYRCPCCQTAHPLREIETVRKSIRGGARFEWRCPESRQVWEKYVWDKV